MTDQKRLEGAIDGLKMLKEFLGVQHGKEEHYGDCTQEPQPCIKCFYQDSIKWIDEGISTAQSLLDAEMPEKKEMTEGNPLDRIEHYREGYNTALDEVRPVVARLEGEITRLKKSCYCLYCGTEFTVGDTHADLSEHIKTCEKRPVYELRAYVARLTQGLAHSQDTLKKCVEEKGGLLVDILCLLGEKKELETILSAWHETFGTTQLTHAKDNLASKEERIRQLSHSNTARRVEMQQEVIEKLEAELSRVREETKYEVVNYWFCATCKRRLELKEVTFEETCTHCGGYTKWIEARLKESKG